MAIGFLIRPSVVPARLGLALLLACSVLRASAEDQLILKSGTTVNGQIVSVGNGQVIFTSRTSNGGVAKLPYRLADIKTVNMISPVDLAKLRATPAPAQITTLEPLVKQYAGLPADWVVDAMGQLADAYDGSNQADRGAAIYAQINELYPGSSYQKMALAGQARQLLKQGKNDEALGLIKPLIASANENLAPSPAEGRLYANAFLVYGQVLEAQKQPGQALEAYLTVTTMFYQNPALVDQAQQLVQALRGKNPGLGVD